MSSCSCGCDQGMYQYPAECAGRSALPFTMELVDVLGISVKGGKKHWNNHDRVLWVLDETQRPYILSFYRGSQITIEELLSKEELEECDLSCLQKLLRWLEEKHAGVYTRLTTE